MPIDAYSLCPGGSGKKIKFCCPDMLADLQKIERMIEGDQSQACLSHIEHLLEKEPDRACLMAIKGLGLRRLQRWDEARVNAEAMVEKHPTNPAALGELAIVTAEQEGGRRALPIFLQALAACIGRFEYRVFEAIFIVSRALLAEGEWYAGRNLLHLQLVMNPKDQQALDVLFQMNGLPDVPLLLKDDLFLRECPADAPWKARFDEAMRSIEQAKWQEGAESLEVLTREVPDAPAIWHNLATVRAWLADTAASIEAFGKLAATDIPFEESIETEALAMLMVDAPLDDSVDLLSVTIPVKDVETLQAALATESRAMAASLGDVPPEDEDSPPPRASYLFFDRSLPKNVDDLSLDTTSQLLGRARLYGRQTDREARLELPDVAADDLQQIREILTQAAGNCVDLQGMTEKATGTISATMRLLRRDWRIPQGTAAEQLDQLTDSHLRKTLLETWPEMKLGVLEGKSALDVAGDPAWQRKLLAIVLVIESWVDRIRQADFDYNALRTRLGLPTMEPIDITSEEEARALPLCRLSRVTVETVSDSVLWGLFQFAMINAAEKSLRMFALAIVGRESMANTEPWSAAIEFLAETETDSEKTLEYIAKGREATLKAGDSCAKWDLMELRVRALRGEGGHLERLFRHLESKHVEEPGVAESLTQFLMDIGAIRPDGTSVQPPSARGPGAETPPPAPETPPGQIWTPDGPDSGGKKKLWTPD